MAIPAHTLLGFVGGVFLLLGILLFLGGSGMVQLKAVCVTPGKAPVRTGIVFMLIGAPCLLAEALPSFSATRDKRPGSDARIERQETEGYSVSLQACKRTTDKVVVCDFLVTSNGRDRTLRLELSSGRSSSNGAVLIDDLGNEYKAASIEIGSTMRRTSFVENRLLADAPTRVRITFLDVKPEAVLAKEVRVQAEGFVVRYRDIPIGE